MRAASMQDIIKFLECKRVAFVGVSRNPQHFSRALFREFIAKGYDPVPVNPQAAEIEARPCFAQLGDVTPRVDAALLMTGAPEATDQAVRECDEAGIRNIWIYKSVNANENHQHAVDFSRQRGSAVIEGYCPFMFLPQPVFFHRAHRFLLRISGSHPH